VRFPPDAFDVDFCAEDFVPDVDFFVEADVEVEADFVVEADFLVGASEDFGDDFARVVEPVFPAAAPADVVPAFFAGVLAPDACFCAALRVVVDLRLACALRIDSAGSDDFASAACAASCCATSSERSPRGKKTSEGRPVS
jgi:hypothetical protein